MQTTSGKWWNKYDNSLNEMIISKMDVDDGLQDSDPVIRARWAGRTDFTPSEQHINSGITDISEMVRMVWAGRTDFAPSTSQMNTGLNDVSSVVRELWLKRIQRDKVYLCNSICEYTECDHWGLLD